MLDVGEVLDSGVFLIVYADDILLYVIGDDEDLARRKLQAILGRIRIWCQSNCLNIEPAKCSTINFQLEIQGFPLSCWVQIFPGVQL